MRVVVVGATGAVGTEILRTLQERNFPFGELVLVASPRSAGRRLSVGSDETEVLPLTEDVFQGGDICLFDVPDDVSRKWAPVAAAAGATVVDNSAAFRMDAEVPLVVPEVNPDSARRAPKGIIASPNCTMLALALPVAALHGKAGLRRLIAASYQSASGAGRLGVEELWNQVLALEKDPEKVLGGLAREVLEPGTAWAHPLAMNVIPQVGSVGDHGYTGEEIKVGEEIRKVLGLPGLPVTVTCVRVPVVVGHAVAVHAEFDRPITPQDARAVLEETPGTEVRDEPAKGAYPTPLEAAGRDPCYVGRIRSDLFDPNALELFCVTDNLRKGAALNTVQVAELLLH